jgi:hypothetical protein
MVSMKPTKDIEPRKNILIIVLMRRVMDPFVTNMNSRDNCHELPHVYKGLVVHFQAHH